MKKTYIIPTLNVVKVQAVRILAGSPNPGFDPNSTTNTMETRRARFSEWDEDYDFEEE